MNTTNKAMEILKDFNEALENNDMVEMAACITAMKQTDPVYLSLMLNAMADEEE